MGLIVLVTTSVLLLRRNRLRPQTRARQGSEGWIAAAIVLAVLVGAIQLGMGLFRLGRVTKYLSHPVISGFTSAAALIIGLSQLGNLMGISIPRGKVHETLMTAVASLGDHDEVVALHEVKASLFTDTNEMFGNRMEDFVIFLQPWLLC